MSGMPKCWNCGHEVVWGCDNMRSKIEGEEYYREEEDAIVQSYHCPHCGTDYEMYHPSAEEMKEYKYWTEDEEDE